MAAFGRAVLAAAAIGSSCFAAAAIAPVQLAVGTAAAQLVPLAGAAPPSPVLYGAEVVGAAPLSAVLHLELYFRPRGGDALGELADAVSDPGSSMYHRFLTVAQFASRFGADPAQVADVDGYLRAEGLSVGPLDRNGLAQSLDGTVARFHAALGTAFQLARTSSGKYVLGAASGPSLPAGLIGDVAYVDGLAPWATPTSALVRWARQGAGHARTTGAQPATTTPPTTTSTATTPATTVPATTAPTTTNSTTSVPTTTAPTTTAPTTTVPPTTAPTTTSPSTTSTTTAPTAQPDPCQGMSDSGLTPSQLAQIYRFNGFYARGDEGQGTTIAFVEYALADRAAISTFLSCTGSSVTVDYVAATKPLPSEVDPEVAADVEVVAALAPKATVVLFESNQAGTGLGPWQMAVSGDGPAGLPDVVSSSWGSCEPQTGLGSSYYAAEETIFEEAAAQGQTVLVASGDDGSEGCYYESENGQLAVDDPASAPYVTAVGGTASDTQSGPEYVWNSHDASAQNCLGTGCWGGASGGGASAIWPRPSYQPDDLPPSPACALGVQGCREIPDVSAMAGDPYAQYCTVCGGGAGWVGLGGTSLSAPSWGTAVLLSENICPTKVGFLNPLLYADPSTLTGPITSGNNDLTGSNQGDYSASPTGGYSMAGGLGYLGGTDLSGGALCGAPEASPAPAGAPNNGASGPGANSASSLRACTKPADHPLRGAPVALAAAEEAGCAGYWALSENGAVASFGAAINFGSTPKLSGTTAVAIAATPDYYGYWVLTANGRVYPFGDASSFGSPYKQHPKAPLVALAPTPDGNGYWLAAADGSVFAYGDARFYGSLSGHHLNQPVIGLTVAPGGQGYWLIAADGGVFELGRARFFGSLASTTLREPVVSASSPAGSDGYWVVGADGGVFSFGAHFYGSLGSHPAPAPVQAIATSVDGKGYYLMDAAGHVYAYGDARYLGNAVP